MAKPPGSPPDDHSSDNDEGRPKKTDDIFLPLKSYAERQDYTGSNKAHKREYGVQYNGKWNERKLGVNGLMMAFQGKKQC